MDIGSLEAKIESLREDYRNEKDSTKRELIAKWGNLFKRMLKEKQENETIEQIFS